VSFWGTENPTFIGWASNWLYADRLPQNEFAGVMTLPRNGFLVNTKEGMRMGFAPVQQVENAFGEAQAVAGEAELQGETFRLRVKGEGPYRVVLSNDQGEQLVAERTEKEFIVDRRKSGEAGAAHEILNDTYGVSREPVMLPENGDMELIFDVSICEVFADGGVFAATNLAFPTKPYTKVTVEGAQADIAWLKM